jgi:hypothetical protein
VKLAGMTGNERKVTRGIELVTTQTLEDLHDAIINKSFGGARDPGKNLSFYEVQYR